MNEEEKMPTYGELYAENFRLEHNYRVVSEREAKLQNNWNELKKWLEEESNNTIYATGHLTAICMTLNKMQELQGDDKS